MNYTVKILEPICYEEFLTCSIAELEYHPFVVEIGGVKYIRATPLAGEHGYFPLLKDGDVLTMQGEDTHYEITVTSKSLICHNEWQTNLNAGYFRGIEQGMEHDVLYGTWTTNLINHINGKNVYSVTDALTGYKEPIKLLEQKIDQDGQMRFL